MAIAVVLCEQVVQRSLVVFVTVWFDIGKEFMTATKLI